MEGSHYGNLGIGGRIILIWIQVEFLWVVTPCNVVVGYSMILRNVGNLPQHHTASQPRRIGIFTVVKTSNLAILILMLIKHLRDFFFTSAVLRVPSIST
jgi:hypothetical protein